MAVSPEILVDFESTIYNVHLSVIMGVVGFTVMMYDHVLTFTDEVQYIWKARKSPVVIMFLLNRYVTPIVLAIDLYDKGGISSYTSQEFCVTWYFVEGMWYVVAFGITHALVSMRVAAMWGRPRWIVVLLVTLWVAYFTVTFGIVLMSLIRGANTVHFEPLLKLCFLSITPYLWACWVPPLLLESVLFVLSCIQAFRAGRYAARTPIIHILHRDGALHFTVIVFCSVFNMITWIVAPPTLVALAKYFGLAIVNTMISRLVLNLRSCQTDFYAPTIRNKPIVIHVEEMEMDGTLSKV
ncbi:hypothetical protein BDV93DRAFT_603198 [Ceratobasidium sp. AG-I]|nr:hypothetical protein BDV93DRAFT_603198 [Ceratobasidium sp. AG-I]